jgi:hypothetical protein
MYRETMSIDPAKIQTLAYAPVVGTDATSPEVQLMREAKKVELQTQIDTKFDAIVERFVVQQPISIPLLGTTVALSLFALAIYYSGKR